MQKASKKRGVEAFKVILLGFSNVGKTCIFDRITHGNFNGSTNPTIGPQFASKLLNVNKMLDSQGRSMQQINRVNTSSRRQGESSIPMRVSN